MIFEPLPPHPEIALVLAEFHEAITSKELGNLRPISSSLTLEHYDHVRVELDKVCAVCNKFDAELGELYRRFNGQTIEFSAMGAVITQLQPARGLIQILGENIKVQELSAEERQKLEGLENSSPRSSVRELDMRCASQIKLWSLMRMKLRAEGIRGLKGIQGLKELLS